MARPKSNRPQPQQEPLVNPNIHVVQPPVPEVKAEEPVVALPVFAEPVFAPEPAKQPEVEAKTVEVKQHPFTKEYFEKAKASGLDYSHKGKWQDMYAKFLNTVFPMEGKVVADLGCAYGAITSAIADVSKGKVLGVDVSEHAKTACPFKNFAFINNDFSNLKDIPDSSVDFIHSMMAFQFIHTAELSKVMSEIKRIAKPNAILFAVFPMSKENTVVNGFEHLNTREFWNEIASGLGFKDGAKAFYTKLTETVIDNWNFMKEYQWNFVVYKIVK